MNKNKLGQMGQRVNETRGPCLTFKILKYFIFYNLRLGTDAPIKGVCPVLKDGTGPHTPVHALEDEKMIKLSSKAQQVVEQTKTRKEDPFDFNTAKPQRTSKVDAPIEDKALKAIPPQVAETEEEIRQLWRKSLMDICSKVGAKIETGKDGSRLVFTPPLDGPDVDPMRYDQALDLEAMFKDAQVYGFI